MKAAQIKTFGGSEVIEIAEVEKPTPGEGQVLLKVYASSINPFDAKLLSGMMPTIPFPFRLGLDVAGVITELGEGVNGLVVGNKVYGSAGVFGGATGAFAEFAAVPANLLAPMPSNLDFNQAAAVVLTGVSALQGLQEHIKLQSGQKILIHGGSGGIGTIAIQLAKHLGAYVVATATGGGIDYAKSLGADEVFDYKGKPFDLLVNECDVVFDTVGGETFVRSFKVLKKGGILVSMVEKDEHNFASQHGVVAIQQNTKVDTEHLNTLTKLIEDNIIKVYIDKIYSFEHIQQAFEEKGHGGVLGKIVIQIN